MDKTKTAIRNQKMNQLKHNEKIDGLLALDNRGYSFYNDGFASKNYGVHSLQRLSQFFFPGQASTTIVTVEGTQTKTTIQLADQGNIIAIRQKKEK